MTSSSELWKQNARLFTPLTSAESTVGIYRGRDGALASVNVGESTVSVPIRGRYRPRKGEPVILTWDRGKIYLSGPARARDKIGTVTAVANPYLTVTVEGISYTRMPYQVSYTAPVVGDTVSIDWDGPYVIGKITASPDEEDVEPKLTTDQKPFTLYFFAKQSGSYSDGEWRTQAIRVSDNSVNGWFYGNALRKSLRDDAYIASLEIYLPLEWNGSTAWPKFGRHTQDKRPSGSLSISDEDQLNDLDPRNKSRKGWVHLPKAWAELWRSNPGGVGIFHGGNSQYSGLPANRQSGKLRIRGRQ